MNRSAFRSLFKKFFYSAFFILISSILSSQVPAITSFSPASGPVGTTVTITGTNFDPVPANNIVWFGAVRATVNSAALTSLNVVVPAGANYQPITVTVNGLTAYSDKPFIATLPGLRIIDATAFASKVDFTTGTNPQGVAIGDIDGDGKPDIVVANWGSDFVSVFRNNSTTGSITSGSFEPKVDFTVGGNSPFVALGDIDGDGKPDMVVASRTGNVVSVFRNTCTPGSITASSFESKVDFAAGDGPDCVAIGDIDSDGKPDLVVTNYNSNTVSVFRNTSTYGTITSGSFAPKVDLATGLQPYFVGLGDLDKDGKPDLVISNYNSYSISIYRNKSTSGPITSGSFDPRVDLITGSRPYGLAIGDIDGDNKPDVSVVSTDNAVVSVFRNQSTTGSITSYSFSPKVDFATGTAPVFVTLGDINGDGKPDLVVENNGSGTVSIFKNNSLPGSIGAGSFSARFDFAGGSSYGIAVGDIDCDGKQDIVVTNGINATVSVLHNEITERVLPVIASFTPTSGPVGTAVTITGSNFNTTPANNIVWFGAVQATVTASTSTQLTVTVPAGATYKPFTVTVTGLTAYSSSPFNVTIPGTNTFDATSLAPKVDFLAGMNPSSVALADIDGDGKPDLIVANSNPSDNTVSVFRNIGTTGTLSAASFLSKIDLYTGSNPVGVTVSDIDGDGKQDIVVANTSNNSVSIFRNMCSPGAITTGSFSARVDLMTSSSPYDVAIGDLDGDGKPDLAVPNYMNNTVSVFRNNSEPGTISTGSFEPRVDFPVGSNPYRVALGDIDGDGKPDLAVTNWSSNSVSILRNLSSAGSFTLSSFATKVDFSTGTNPGQIAIADIDGDGKQDVILANQNGNSFSIFRNRSTSGLLTPSSLAPRADFFMGTSTGARALAVGDIDGDGKPDLVIGNSFPGNNKSYVFRNTSTLDTITAGSFAARLEFTAGNEPSNIAIGDLDGDGKADLVVTSANSISLIRNKLSEPLPLTISSFSPTSGAVGTSVIISGTNFNTTPSNNIIWFGAVQATVSAATATQLTVTVPAGTTYQPISVTVNGLTAFSSSPFAVTFPGTHIIDATVFASKVDLTTGSSPSHTSISDIDGDGKADLIVTNNGSNTVSVFRNISTSGSITSGSFAANVDFITGTNPSCVATGDIDGDGKQDIIVTNWGSSTISVFRNTSTSGSITNGSFAAKVDFTTGSDPDDIAVGDIDGDGRPDIAVINSGTVSVFRNISSPGSITIGSLAARIDFPTGSSPTGVAIGDIDGDGKQDIAISNYGSNSVSILKNISTSGYISASSFAAKVDFTTGTNPKGVAINDIDGDNKPDLVVLNYSDRTLSIFRNTSISGSFTAGSFDTRIDFTTGLNPCSFTVSDINGDSKPDIAVINNGDNTVSILSNTSTSGSITSGSFSAKIDFSAGYNPRNLTVGDLDGDGRQDLIVTNYNINTVSVLQNTISFSVPVPPVITSFNPTSGPIGTTVIITGSNFSTTTANNIVWFGAVQATVTAATTTQLIVIVPAGATYQPITVTVDGLTAYSGAPFNVTFSGIQNIDATTFPVKVDFNTGIYPTGIAIVDIDGDGKPDLIVANQSGNTVSVFRNTCPAGSVSEGSFAPRVDFVTLSSPHDVIIGDIDGDGKPDLVVSNSMSSNFSVLRNISTLGSISTSSFDTRIDFPAGTGPISFSLAICDIDCDGKSDIAITNYASKNVSVFRNTSTTGSITTGSFVAKVDFSTGTGSDDIIFSDIDGDGKPDLIVLNPLDNMISVFRNTSTSGSITTGSFAPKVEFATGSNPKGIVIGDLDGDGKPDLAVINYNSFTVSVLRNTSTPGSITSGSFALKADITTSSFPYNIAIGDIDGDSKPDLAVLNQNSNTVSIFRNTSTSGTLTSGSFEPKIDFAAGNDSRNVAIGDIDGDGKPDLVVTNSGSNTVSVLRNAISAPVPPVITSFTPASGQVGTTVTITGTFFSPTPANNIVKFGTLQAVVTAATPTQLTVILPAGSTDNPISVTVNGLTGSSATSFVVTAPSPPPVITSLSRTFGYIGMTLIINGTNFSTTPANNIVWFGAVRANVTAATATQLQVTVPTGATYQPVTVTVNGLTAYSRSPFIVTFPSLQIFDGSTLAPKVEIPCSSGWSYFAVICDIDVDGKPDLIVVNVGKIQIYRNTGNQGSISTGSFTAGVELTISGGAYGVAVGDIDGDGKPDIAATSHGNNLVTVLRNQSTPGSITNESFGAGIDFQTGSRPTGIAIGDIDGDGKPDLAVSNYGDGVSQSSYTVSILKNTGMPGSISSGSFAPKVDFQSSHGGVYVAFNDLDMDGKPDLIITTFTMSISIFRNTSTPGEITTGSFAPKVDLMGSNGLNSSAVGDIDGDGKPDLVFVNRENSSISVLRNVSTPGSITRNSFSASIEFPTGAKPVDVKLGDIDGDGKPDMVVAKEDSYISLFRNTCSPGTINTGSFASKVEFNTVYGNGNLVIGDIDGDTKPDIVLKHWYENHISILRNNMPFPNLPVINSIDPNSGPVGSTITINGSNFSPVAGNNTIMFGTVQGTVTSATNNQLTVTVPAGADGQDVIIMVYGYWINSGITFSVVAPENIELESAILTLNGDGINEIFRVKNFQVYGQCKFYVYNSRGAVVYWNDDFQGEWDVTLHNRRFDTGGYFYVIETSIGTFRGSFSILK